MAAVVATVLGIYAAIPNWLKYAIGILLVLAIVFMAGDVRGKRIARAECEAAAQRAQTAANTQDQTAGRDLQQQDDQITTFLTQQKKDDDAKIAALTKQLSSSSRCVYDKSTADPDLSGRVRPSR